MATLNVDNPACLSVLIAERRVAEQNYIKCLQAMEKDSNNEERMRDFLIAREVLWGAKTIQDMYLATIFNRPVYD